MMWTQQEAIELAKKVEAACPPCGCHVALTGGLLYKEGPRKDCDLLFYRIRQTPNIDMNALRHALGVVGFTNIHGWGWCFKAKFEGKPLDLFFPEEKHGNYIPDDYEEKS